MTASYSIQVNSVLQHLTDGKFHSGRALSENLRVSRSSIWNAVQTLRRFGLAVDAVPGRGYRLQNRLELLNKDAILDSLHDDSKRHIRAWHLFPVIESTSQFLKSRIRQENIHGHVCVAEMQTQGRGRRGRQWVSPFGRNLYFSLAWCFKNGLNSLMGLSAAVAVSVLQSLQKAGARDLQLKWPNDILSQGQKLVGILLDASGEFSGECQVIIGIGINVSMGKAHDPIDQAWTDLSRLLAKTPSRNVLLASILDELLPDLQQFESQGFKAFHQAWSQHDMLKDKPVTVYCQGDTKQGVARGIDEFGALWVETETGKQRFHHAELSVRLR